MTISDRPNMTYTLPLALLPEPTIIVPVFASHGDGGFFH